MGQFGGVLLGSVQMLLLFVGYVGQGVFGVLVGKGFGFGGLVQVFGFFGLYLCLYVQLFGFLVGMGGIVVVGFDQQVVVGMFQMVDFVCGQCGVYGGFGNFYLVFGQVCGQFLVVVFGFVQGGDCLLCLYVFEGVQFSGIGVGLDGYQVLVQLCYYWVVGGYGQGWQCQQCGQGCGGYWFYWWFFLVDSWCCSWLILLWCSCSCVVMVVFLLWMWVRLVLVVVCRVIVGVFLCLWWLLVVCWVCFSFCWVSLIRFGVYWLVLVWVVLLIVCWVCVSFRVVFCVQVGVDSVNVNVIIYRLWCICVKLSCFIGEVVLVVGLWLLLLS